MSRLELFAKSLAREVFKRSSAPVALLEASGIRNTVMNIMLKSYVMRRVVKLFEHLQAEG